MPTITSPPTPKTFTTEESQFIPAFFSARERLQTLIQAKIVLLNYKTGKSYIGNQAQLTIDAAAAYAGLTPESWGAGDAKADAALDPGAVTVGQFWQQANFRDSVNMPSTVAAIVKLFGMQVARPMLTLQQQNAYLDILLLALWG